MKISGRIHRSIGYRLQVSSVKYTLMGFAVLSHHTGTVDSENHLDVLKGDVMNQFVIRALQKSGIHGKYGKHPADSQAAGKGYGMLL